MDVTHFTHSIECDGLNVQYDLCLPGKSTSGKHKCDKLSVQENTTYQQKIIVFEQAYSETLAEIERLTSHADGVDYTIAVASGLLSGILDSFLGTDASFSIARANEWGDETVKNFVIEVAQKQGCSVEEKKIYTNGDLSKAVEYLEDKFSIAADKATNDFGGGKQHHLRDFSHHPTPVGLFFSMLTQFSGKVYGTDVAGKFHSTVISNTELIGNSLPEKVTFGTVNWAFHMVSDMAGSSGSIRDGSLGTGLPGPLVSLLKELSSLPFFRKMDEKGYKEFSVWVSKLFNGTLLAERDQNGKILNPVKFDLRTEIGIAHELGPQIIRQPISVILNECIVRAFYFIRRLLVEIKNNDVRSIADLQKIQWEHTLPRKNRTIVRMLAISTGVMEIVDLVDAGVRSGGALPVFVLRVNFVGVGRFAIAGSSDIMMGIKKERLELAVASAEIAKTAQATLSMIDSMEQRREVTQKKLNQVAAKVNKTAKLKF